MVMGFGTGGRELQYVLHSEIVPVPRACWTPEQSWIPTLYYRGSDRCTGDRRTMRVVGRVVIFQSLSSRAIFSPTTPKGEGRGQEGEDGWKGKRIKRPQ